MKNKCIMNYVKKEYMKGEEMDRYEGGLYYRGVK